MSREPPPCSACVKFAPDHCDGFDRPAQPDDRACVLFLPRGRAARTAGRTEAEVLADLRRRYPEETISRASASDRRTAT